MKDLILKSVVFLCIQHRMKKRPIKKSKLFWADVRIGVCFVIVSDLFCKNNVSKVSGAGERHEDNNSLKNST